MKKHWWKIFAVILLIYTIAIGLLVPLRPGISEIQPSRAKAGATITFEVKGYNSHYEQAGKSLKAWLKLDTARAFYGAEIFTISDQNIRVLSENQMEVTFHFPSHFPDNVEVKDLALIIDNEIDGPSVLPSAVFLGQDSIDVEAASSLWQSGQIPNLHDAGGLSFPFRNILGETIRNTYFHVPLWFGMIIILAFSMVYSWKHLQRPDSDFDRKAVACVKVGILYGLLGLVTGALWAKNTWGEYWSGDVKQNMSAIALLIYLAYFVLRGSFDAVEQKSRISAVYNIFAFAAMIPLLFVIPRMYDSLHPGNGGNPGFGGEDLDNTMRMVFYPAIIGWTLLGLWIANLAYRIEKLQDQLYDLLLLQE